MAAFVASLPIIAPPPPSSHSSSPTTRHRDPWKFLLVTLVVCVAQCIYTVLTTPRSSSRGRSSSCSCSNSSRGIAPPKDLSNFHCWMQLVCSCTLFLLFCQGFPGGSGGGGKTKANGTLLSSFETYAEHAYTLPLLVACRLASSPFGMDPAAAAAVVAGAAAAGGGGGGGGRGSPRLTMHACAYVLVWCKTCTQDTNVTAKTGLIFLN